MIDTHCHLTFPDYEGRVDAVLAEAKAAGVTGAITIATTTQDSRDTLALAEAHEKVWCTAGVHPLYADKGPHDWSQLRRSAASPKCVAFGELGLDNHYSKPPQDLQQTVLAEQIAAIRAIDAEITAQRGRPMPIVLHCRKAFGDLIPILKGTTLDPARFVFHCFTGDSTDMRMLLDFGAMVSFTGVVTYKNAPEVREAAKLAPADRVMVETDAPFLTPEPNRSVRPNEPKFVVDTARYLADIRSEDFDAFHAQLNRNTERFFGFDRVD